MREISRDPGRERGSWAGRTGSTGSTTTIEDDILDFCFTIVIGNVLRLFFVVFFFACNYIYKIHKRNPALGGGSDISFPLLVKLFFFGWVFVAAFVDTVRFPQLQV